jgi:hypothetical protein
MDYSILPELAGPLLEESWVLAVTATVASVSFEMEFVLLPGHPDHRSPEWGEQFPYKRGVMEIRGIERLTWSGMVLRPAVDASGEQDRGHIDSFLVAPDEWTLSGDWGTLQLSGTELAVSALLPTGTSG